MIFLLIVPLNHCRSFLRFHCSVCFLERVQVTNFLFRALLLCACVCGCTPPPRARVPSSVFLIDG